MSFLESSGPQVIQAWIDADPDPLTRRTVADLLAQAEGGDPGAVRALDELFGAPLRFGTSGIRGPLGAGPARMNRAVVRRLTAGVAGWLEPRSTVVLARDARRMSDVFAADIEAVLDLSGHTCVPLPDPVPTPVLAFAVRHLSADAGLMVTASHNPPGDNGVKVFAADGAQIVSPHDAAISASMVATLPSDRLASPTVPPSPVPAGEGDRGLVAAYVDALGSVLRRAPEVPGRQDRPPIVVAYTALHGVAASITAQAFARVPYVHLDSLAQECRLDPSFGGLASPNPESAEAMDGVIRHAVHVGAVLALAHDPDGDRLGVAVPRPGASGGTPAHWTSLSGDQIGALLADHLLRRPPPPGDHRPSLVVGTVVSSRLVKRIAEDRGAAYVDTLTGFKWIMRAGIERPDHRWVFGYEQALGFAVSDRVRDKDGISAALVVAELVAELSADGRTVWDRIDELHRAYGHHAVRSASLSVPSLAALTRSWERFRSAEAGETCDFRASPPSGFPPADLLIRTFPEGTRVAVRPSGTEPVLKIYVEAVGPAEHAEALEARAAVVLADTRDELARCSGDLTDAN